MSLKNIAEGWGKSIGIFEVTEDVKKMSVERMKFCSVCPEAKESSFLKFIRGNMNNVSAIKCTKCGCPVNEKSLVQDEKCPLNKW